MRFAKPEITKLPACVMTMMIMPGISDRVRNVIPLLLHGGEQEQMLTIAGSTGWNE